jgi:murein DD-endopeptidase MepM/ murein hydrolase activator NlpD
MRDSWTLGEPPRKRHIGPLLVLMLLGTGVASGLWWWKHRSARTAPVAQREVPKPPPAEPGRATPSPDEILKRSGVRFISVSIDGALERSLVGQTGKELGQALAQVVTRTLVWWVSVPADLRRGDRLDVLFEERTSEEPIAHAIRFASAKLGKTFRAYRYKPPDFPFARYYGPSAEEVELRIKDSPLDEYEQVTSLVKDGRRHKGVDFKTPVNSKVKATFDGTLTKRNWNFRGNGNCIEVTESGGQGRRALFLHLSELPKSLQVGARILKGEVIALSGNSGHSFAPHLHYQLMRGERLIDPYASHETYRRALGPEQKQRLDNEIARLDGLMATALAGK